MEINQINSETSYCWFPHKNIFSLLDFNNFPDKPNDVMEKCRRVQLNWKHNLELGSTPEIVHSHDTFYNQIADLAIQAAQAISISFASVDIIQTEDTTNPYRVIEINSGVMMENFIKLNQKKGYELAKEIYRKAICCYFDIP